MDRLDLSDLPSSNDPTEVLAHSPTTASCLPVTVTCIPREAELVHDVHPTARIFVAHEGRGRRWYRQGGRMVPMRTEPGMIEIYEKGLVFDHCRWSGAPGRCILVDFSDADVEAMTHGEMQALPLRTQHEVFDERVSRIVFGLAGEALAGLPNGRLYAQGLSVALLGLLGSNYVSAARQSLPLPPGRIGFAQQRRLVELIEGQLGSDLSLTRLAEEIGLSTFHFARAFKATFGVTPHLYVQGRRLDAAARALRSEHGRPIADIALACGFSSQSHMTELMRRKMGTTPRGMRQWNSSKQER